MARATVFLSTFPEAKRVSAMDRLGFLAITPPFYDTYFVPAGFDCARAGYPGGGLPCRQLRVLRLLPAASPRGMPTAWPAGSWRCSASRPSLLGQPLRGATEVRLADAAAPAKPRPSSRVYDRRHGAS